MTLEEQLADHAATIESKDGELAAATELLESASLERDEAVAALEAKNDELKASAEQLVSLETELATLNEGAVEATEVNDDLEAKINDLSAKVEELENSDRKVDEEVAEAAAEIAASAGSEPVEAGAVAEGDEEPEAKPELSVADHYAKVDELMKGDKHEEARAYYLENIRKF